MQIRKAKNTTNSVSYLEVVRPSSYLHDVRKGDDGRVRLWWVPIALGAAFAAIAVIDVFDPTSATPNPYNYVELYAEMPLPELLQNLVRIALGILGIISLVVVEYGLSETSRPRALRSPGRCAVFILAVIGFSLEMLNGLRTVFLVPDMAHYYYAGAGALEDITALVLHAVQLDRYRFILLTGAGAWTLYLSVDLLIGVKQARLLGALGCAVSGSLFALLLSVVSDRGALLNAILAMLVPGFLVPIWFTGVGILVRRRRYGKVVRR